MTRIVGLTGGIGTGKSFVANEFYKLGVPVYYSDNAGKDIMSRKEVIHEVNHLFNQKVLLSNGTLDRPKIKKIVFENSDKLAALNAIIHPLVKKDFMDWLVVQKEHKYIIKESALLFETKSHLNCWKTILVTADLQKRIEIIKKRDGISENEILKIMKQQMSEDEKKLLADYELRNDYSNQIVKEIKNLYEKLNKF